jgi:subtilisin family serine protease
VSGYVIAVGATTRYNTRAGFSNYGSALDVVAPGVDILSTTLNNGYNSQNGTTFAAPQISGFRPEKVFLVEKKEKTQKKHSFFFF